MFLTHVMLLSKNYFKRHYYRSTHIIGYRLFKAYQFKHEPFYIFRCNFHPCITSMQILFYWVLSNIRAICKKILAYQRLAQERITWIKQRICLTRAEVFILIVLCIILIRISHIFLHYMPNFMPDHCQNISVILERLLFAVIDYSIREI